VETGSVPFIFGVPEACGSGAHTATGRQSGPGALELTRPRMEKGKRPLYLEERGTKGVS
jgi:hypothetical protein